ncbi:hypothetical protein ACQ4PT_003525 [Festuca glaucescens]
MGHPEETAEDDINKNPRPLDLDGREIALRSPPLGNTPAPHQCSNSKSESEDTLPDSDGYHDGRLDNLRSHKYNNSFGEAMDAIMAEYEQLRVKNMAEAEDMHDKLMTTVGESEELYNLQLTEYMNCYKKARVVLEESTRLRAVVGAELKGMLQRIYSGEEVSQEEQIRCLEKILEICQRPFSSPRIADQ